MLVPWRATWPFGPTENYS